MKILVLNYEYPPLGGGAAPVSRDISMEFQKRGHEVTLLTMGFGSLPEHENQNGVEIYRLKCIRKKMNSCQPWEQYSYLCAVRKFMKNHPDLQKCDVCHTHFVIPTGEVALYLKKKYGIPYVITAHGSDVEGHNKKTTMKIMHRILRTSWRNIVKNAYCVISPSSYLKDLMEKNYSKAKYEMIPNGIDIKKYEELNCLKDKKKKILIMGRLQKFKNVQTIINAIALVDLKDWSVDILGDGPYRKELEKQVRNLNLESKITFHGWIENNSSEQLKFLKESSIYISASQFENCPMSVIETIAAGDYPLLSDIPAHRQLVSENEFYFAPNDTKGLAKKIEEKLTLEITEFQYDLNKYDWCNIGLKYEDILKNAKDNESNEMIG